MLRAAVCVSGGGTNLQAIIDAAAAGTITNTELALVISNKPGAYALERAKKAEFHPKSSFRKITKTEMLLEKH